MSDPQPMGSLRRPMPGMPAAPPTPPPRSTRVAERPSAPSPDPDRRAAAARTGRGSTTHIGRSRREREPQRSENYGATRLANFRLPVDLHDRMRELVRETELAYPQMRRMSLTEVIIALLEEGPGTPQEIADLLRRKRTEEAAR